MHALEELLQFGTKAPSTATVWPQYAPLAIDLATRAVLLMFAWTMELAEENRSFV